MTDSLLDVFKAATRRCNHRESNILAQFVGLFSNPIRAKRIAKMNGVSKSRVYDILAKARSKCRREVLINDAVGDIIGPFSDPQFQFKPTYLPIRRKANTRKRQSDKPSIIEERIHSVEIYPIHGAFLVCVQNEPAGLNVVRGSFQTRSEAQRFAGNLRRIKA